MALVDWEKAQNRADLLTAPVLYTPADVAAMFGVSRRTVYSWISSGAIGSIKAGPKLRYITREHLVAFMGVSGREALRWTAPAPAPSRPAAAAPVQQQQRAPLPVLPAPEHPARQPAGEDTAPVKSSQPSKKKPGRRR